MNKFILFTMVAMALLVGVATASPRHVDIDVHRRHVDIDVRGRDYYHNRPIYVTPPRAYPYYPYYAPYAPYPYYAPPPRRGVIIW